MSSTLRSNWADEAAPTSEAWWETFFKGPFGELQLLPLPVDTTQQDVERVTATLGGGTHRILDAPCGAGRHSLELARRGHQVVGIDFNPQVLEAARSRAQAEALLVDFRLQDLRRLRPSETFDAVTNLWTSFGYFSDAENQALLKNPAGLTDFRCLGDNGGAFTFGDQRLWLEARKPL